MTEGKELSTIEEKVAVVDSWITEISANGKVGEIESSLTREVLENFGANFEIGEDARESLGEYTNKGKRPGLDAVWGAPHVAEFKEWLDEYVITFEANHNNRELPQLILKSDPEKSTRSKTAGMLQFFGELTAFAAGVMSSEDFGRYTEARALNGKLWQENRGDERVRIKVPTADEPILLASFPPGFPSRAWSKIKEWRTA